MIPEFTADFFDGRTSRRHAVKVGIFGGTVSIRGDDVSLDVPRAETSVQPRLGHTPVRIELPGGGLLVAPDADAVETALGIPQLRTLAHRLETNAKVVVAALVGLIAGGWFAYSDGIPWLSRKIAEHVPPAVEAQLSTESLKAFDGILFAPSQVGRERRQSVTAAFEELARTANLDQPVRLEFRKSDIMKANAVTLPGGLVVVTDQLIEAMDDKQVAAVLAHELGHVRHRHGMRHVLNNSMHALIAMAVFGDVHTIGNVAVLVPAIFMNTGYSRDFEREADAYAFDLLRRSGRSPLDFAHALDTLRRLTKDEARRYGNLGYLKTHPDIEERMEAAEDAARPGTATRQEKTQ